jgi:3-hydroxy-9,10-secoandrosta-1,3,5(10)-triene-9,17-dione monooxygenase
VYTPAKISRDAAEVPFVTDSDGRAVSREQLVERARGLVPSLLGRAPQAEHLRRVPDASVSEIRAAQLARTLRPTRYGGFEQDYRTFGHVVRELGHGCASTAWCAATWMAGAMTLTMFPAETQDEICFANPDTHIGSTGIPSARAERVEGGWLVNGRWSFASGVHGADFMMCGVTIPEGKVRCALIPTGHLKILDVWDTIGLRGTGSTDTVAEDVFVPAHYCIEGALWAVKPPSAPFIAGPMRKHRVGTTQVNVGLFSSTAIGNAEAFLETFIAGASGRSITFARQKQSENVATQLRLAESALEVDLAWMLLERCYDVLDEYEATGEIPLETRSRMRRDTAYAVNLAYGAVNRVFEVSGAHALASSGELQRRWRDAHAIASQPQFHWDFEAETWAKIRFGLPHTHPNL